MMTEDGPKVLEYNARFGDPEAQVVLPRMQSDLVEIMEHCIDGTLDEIDLVFDDGACATVVLASNGYPLSYEKLRPVTVEEGHFGQDGYYLFHAGSVRKDGVLLTNGGRVFDATATGKDLKEAIDRAYAATEWVSFDNKYMRHDIGAKALQALQ